MRPDALLMWMLKGIWYWLKFIVPMEICGAATAVCCGVMVHHLFSQPFITAFAAAWGENIGFYAYGMAREMDGMRRKHRECGTHLSTRRMWLRASRNLCIDFGPAELIDSTFARPFCMLITQDIWQGMSWNVLTGKIAADCFFVLPLGIAMYLRKKYVKN